MRILHHVHKHLHLQHHRHTGRLIHHRHTSYRGLAIVLVLAGASMAGITIMQRVAADTLIGISAAVVATPTTPAILSIPADGDTLNSTETTVAGSCPIVEPQAVVALVLDDATVGSAICDSNNDFTAPLHVSPGEHTLATRVYTITGKEGQTSQPIHLAVHAATAAAASSQVPSLTSDTLFVGLGTDQTASWSGTLSGTQPSYKLLVDWGDDSREQYTVSPGAQHFNHHYANFDSYNVSFVIADASRSYQQQYAVAAYTVASTKTADTLVSAHRSSQTSTAIGLYGLFVTLLSIFGIVRLHAAPFAYAEVKLTHHGQN